MKGTRDTRTNLYMLNLNQKKKLMTESTTPDKYFAGSAYECKSKTTLVDYHHAFWLRPTQYGRGKEITKSFFTSYPGLSLDLVHKHLTKKQSTILGHLKKSRKGIISTQEMVTHSEPDTEQDQFPPSTQSEDTNIVFFKPVDLSGKIYTDQTGKFSVTSSKDNNYIMVAYHYGSNTIHAEPLKTRSGLNLTASYQKLNSLLNNRGLILHLNTLENECPNVLKIFMKEVNGKIQLVPPHIHQRNSAERAISTLKDYFIAGLSSTHKDLPLHLWCQIIPRTILTLNLLRESCMKPKLSEYAQLNGDFNYDATPLAVPGTQVIINEKPTVRGMWESYGVKEWYLGPSMNHYRCHHVCVTKTRGKRDSDCVYFLHIILHSPTIFPQTLP